MSQVKQRAPKTASRPLRDFLASATDADVIFTFPDRFKETSILNKQNFPFDYAMETTDHSFEVWFKIKSHKKDILNQREANPDTAYLELIHTAAQSLGENENFIIRDISNDALLNFNASAGKSYVISLPDQPETKHFKYALILAIEKSNTGTILAVCFTDNTNTDFFRNVNHLSQYIRFKP